MGFGAYQLTPFQNYGLILSSFKFNVPTTTTTPSSEESSGGPTMDRQLTPSAANPRRCSSCGELTKGHGLLPPNFCEQVRQLKVKLKAIDSSGPPKAVVKTEDGPEPSASHYHRASSRQKIPGRLPAVRKIELEDTDSPPDTAIIPLRVRSRPDLKSQFAPILEMKTLLQLKGPPGSKSRTRGLGR